MTDEMNKQIAADILIAALQKQDIDKLFIHGLHASDDAHIRVINRLNAAYTSLYENIAACSNQGNDES